MTRPRASPSHTAEEFMPMLPGNSQTIREGIQTKDGEQFRGSPSAGSLQFFSLVLFSSWGVKPHLENYWCPAVHYGHHWELAYGLVNRD